MVDDDDLEAWFCREVLPLERALTHFIHRNWRVAEDVTDLRHDVYELAIPSARKGLPVQTRPFIFTIARTTLINRANRAKIVSFAFLSHHPQLYPKATTPQRQPHHSPPH